MDWQERIRRNRERIVQESSEWGGISSQFDLAGFKRPIELPKDEQPEMPGFFDDLLGGAADVTKKVYDFGKGIVDDVVDSASTAVEAVGAGIGSLVDGDGGLEIRKARQEERKKLFAAAEARGWSDPREVAAANAFDAETERMVQPAQERQEAATERLNAVDPTKAAAASADTFLNAATLGLGGVVKGVAKGGVTNLLRGGAKKALTSREAMEQIGRYAFEGGTIGAAQSGLQVARQDGADASWRDIATSSLTGGALGAVMGAGSETLLNKQLRQAVPGLVREGRDAVSTAAANAGEGYMRLAGGYSPGFITPDGLGVGRVARDGAEFADDIQYSTPFDDLDTTQSNVKATETLPTEDTINLNKMSAARREKIVQALNGDSEIGLDSFTPVEKKIIKNHVDNVIAKESPELEQHMMGGFDADAYNRGDGGDLGLPVLTKEEIINHFGNLDDYPIAYRVKKDAPGRVGVDIQAKEAGFDDVDEFLEAARQKVKAIRDNKDMEGLLRDARKDPGFINKAIRELISEDTIDRTRGPYLSRAQQGYTPARVVEARTNNALDYTGSYRDERPSRLSDVTRNIYGEAPAPRVAANPVDPATPLPEWSRDLMFGQDPVGRPQLALPSGLPEAPAGPVNLNRTQLKRMARDGTLPENYTIGAKPASATPIVVDETGAAGRPTQFKDQWNMDDAKAALGGEEPLLGPNGKPVLFRGQPIPAADEAALLDIMDTGKLEVAGNFKDVNGMIDDITRDMEGGRMDSKGGQLLDRVYNTIGHQSGDESRRLSSWRSEIDELSKKFTFNAKESDAANRWLQAGADKTNIEAELRKEFGDELVQKTKSFFEEAKPRLARFIKGYNDEMIANGLPDRVIGEIDPEKYFPRIYKNPSVVDKITDALGGGSGQVDTIHAGIAGNGFDPNNMSGTTTRTDMALPNNPRAAGQAPIGSADNRPNTGYNSFAQHRTAKSAQAPMVNPMEALSKYGEVMTQQTARVKAVSEIRRLERIAKAIQEKTGDNRLTPIINTFTNSANALTGKTNVLDRGFIDTAGGQKWMRIMGTISKSLSRSQLLGSVSTVAAQTGQLPLMVSKLGPDNYAKGIKLMQNTAEFAKYAEKSNFLARNFPENKSVFSADAIQAAIEKGSRITGKPMEVTAEFMAKTSYAGAIEDGLAKNLKGQKLIDYADRIAAGINADRVAGLRSNAYESRVLQPIVMYTQDVNQMYQAMKRFVGEKNYKAMATLLAAGYAYNLGYEQVTGNKLIADPLNAAIDAGGIMTDQDLVDENGDPIGLGERTVRAAGRIGGEAAAATPLGNAILGTLYPERGVRMPFGSGERMMSRADLFGDSQVGRFGGSMPITSAFENPLHLLGIPGASQLQKSYEGVSAFSDGASVSPSGTERFEIDQNAANFIRALIFGPYQTEEGRAYLKDRTDRLQGYQIP
jgi:hypothetical protein